MPDDHGEHEAKVSRRIEMSFAGIDKLYASVNEDDIYPWKPCPTITGLEPRYSDKYERRVSPSDHFKCPNCGKTHHTASFVKCEYCGFGRPTPIMNNACSASVVVGVFGYDVVKPGPKLVKRGLDYSIHDKRKKR